MRRKFTVLSLLSVVVIALGIALPAYMNRDQPVAIGGPFHTPRPTSTQFSEPLREIVQIVDAEESETNDDITNCTYPLYYWKDYPDSWPAQIVIAGLIYTQADIFEIYHDPDPDTATLLIRQLYTAFLNILGGSNHARIDPVIVDANNWLAANPPGTAISEHNQSIGMNLAASLEDYNDGLNGPPACQDVPPSPTPSPTVTDTLVPTVTPTPTNTRVPQTVVSPPPSDNQPLSNNQPTPPGAPSQPTATQAVPTALLPSPTLILVPPTAAPSPTQVLVPPTAAPTPTLRPVIPTATNPPPPTLRPVIPTATNTPRPPSTNTPIPPTPANTPSPVPTSSFTPVPPTEAPPPASTATPLPTITDTPTPDGLLPTRNPHYASPTPP
jgi:hypothetical protein